MFGEMIGLALAQAWLDRGAPAPLTLAELGPGRGTLMADALDFFGDAANYGVSLWVLGMAVTMRARAATHGATALDIEADADGWEEF